MGAFNLPPNVATDFVQDKLKELAAHASENNIQWDSPHPDQVDWDNAKPKAAPSWGDALASAPGAALGEIGDAAKGAYNFVTSLPNDPLGYKIGRALKAAPGAIANDVGGMAQFVRNLSHPEFRGSAPQLGDGSPEAHPYLSLTQGNDAPMRQNVADRPLGVLGDAAAVAGLTGPGRYVLGKGADLAMAGPRKLARTLADMTPANRSENALLAAANQGGGADKLAALLQSNRSSVPGVDFSAAQATQDPAITALERQSRLNPSTAPAWAGFDAGQNTGLVQALGDIVNPATDDAVKAAQDKRAAATKYDRDTALALADQHSLEPPSFSPYGRQGDSMTAMGTPSIEGNTFTPNGNQFAQPIRNAADAELNGDRGVLPAVQAVGNWVQNSIPATGATAGRAYEVRKKLADALNQRFGADPGDIGSSIKSADVSSRAIKSSIDASLDKASGGLWQQYLDAFKANSKDVNSVQALSNIREELESKIAGGALDANGNPKLSRAYINQIIERHATNKYGDLIAPDIKAKLDNIRSTAQQMEAPNANYRLATTGGGGSDTVPNMALAGAGHAASAFGLGPLVRFASSVGRGVTGLGADASAQRLAQLLQNQGSASQALQTAAERAAARKAVNSTGITPAMLAALLAAQPQQ